MAADQLAQRPLRDSHLDSGFGVGPQRIGVHWLIR